MSSSLTKKGLVAIGDHIIMSAEPALELIKLFSTDCSVDPSRVGATVSVKVLSSTAANFAKSSQNYVTATNTVKYADVTVNKDKISVFGLDDLDAIEDDVNPIIPQFGAKSGAAIRKAIVGDITGLLTYSAAAAQKTMAGTSTLANFAAIRGLAESASFDPADCVVILEPDTYANLVSVLPASVVGTGGVVNTALIGQQLGFKAIIEGPTISKASGASASLGKGFVVPTDAIVFASRVKKAIRAGGNLIEEGMTVDDATGFAVTQRVVVNPADGECYWSSEALYGVALAKQTISGVTNGAPGFLQLVTAA